MVSAPSLPPPVPALPSNMPGIADDTPVAPRGAFWCTGNTMRGLMFCLNGQLTQSACVYHNAGMARIGG